MIEPPKLLALLQHWVDCGALRSLDLALTNFVQQQQPQSSAVLLACALVSERNGHGHVCLDLQAALQQPHSLLSQQNTSQDCSQQLAELLNQLSLQQWLEQLSNSSVVANQLSPTQQPDNTPLVLGGSSARPLLYLRRYWQYEQQIHGAIEQRLQQQHQLPAQQTRQLLEKLFSQTSENDNDWQKIACLLAARNSFAVITGGPGTGKTTTVVRLLALLQALQLQAQEPSQLMIHLAAPTGKAAARLSESISANIDGLKLDGELGEQVRQSIPREVTTLHRLLGSRPDSRHFRHNLANPLPTDLVVVDEASMMDVEMMAQLVNALPANARLILLGDKDQLASVEAGSVLADLCQGADAAHYTSATCNWLKQMGDELIADNFQDEQGSNLQQAICMLRHSYRFSSYPGIGALANLVNNAQVSNAKLDETFAQYPQSLQRLQPGDVQQGLPHLTKLAVAGYRHYLQCLQQMRPDSCEQELLQDWANAVFRAHASFQLLTAMRQGDYGIDNLNQLIQQALQKQGLIDQSKGNWYHGRPVLVTRNDYGLRLMNGDIGICMQWPDQSLRVAFVSSEGDIRWILPGRLQAVETVFAMTVHKSQGSEFTHTALVLPDHHSPVLSKELIYTAITRSKEKFSLVCASQQVLQQALASRVQRASGLDLTLRQQD